MKRFIASILFAAFSVANGAGISNGVYELSFRLSDTGNSQEIIITNCSSPNPSILYFDMLIDKKGTFNRFGDAPQRVRGLVYMDKFSFVIPFANLPEVQPFFFAGFNIESNGYLFGQGHYTIQKPNEDESNFHFQMKRKDT